MKTFRKIMLVSLACASACAWAEDSTAPELDGVSTPRVKVERPVEKKKPVMRKTKNGTAKILFACCSVLGIGGLVWGGYRWCSKKPSSFTELWSGDAGTQLNAFWKENKDKQAEAGGTFETLRKNPEVAALCQHMTKENGEFKDLDGNFSDLRNFVRSQLHSDATT